MPGTVSTPFTPPEAPDDVRRALEGHGYLADDGLATAIFLAMVLRRPLFIEGEPGHRARVLRPLIVRCLRVHRVFGPGQRASSAAAPEGRMMRSRRLPALPSLPSRSSLARQAATRSVSSPAA